MKLYIDIPKAIIDMDRKPIAKALRQAAKEVMTDAAALIRASVGTGPRGASRPGDAPSNKTGRLARSMKISTKGMTATVTDFASSKDGYYAVALEEGARGGGGNKRAGRNKRHKDKITGKMVVDAVTTKRVLLPRPFLSTALGNKSDDIARRLQKAIMSGVEFKLVK